MEWKEREADRAFRESYFAITMNASDEIGEALSNYLHWWRLLTQAVDPNDVSPEAGALV